MKLFRVTSLKKNHSDHPVSVSQPAVAKHSLRRTSSGRRDGILLTSEPLRRNSSGKDEHSFTFPRVSSMLKRAISNSDDTMTPNTPSVKSFPESSYSQNRSNLGRVYRSNLVPSTISDHTSMLENEVNTLENINQSHKSSSLDTHREEILSCPDEVSENNPKSVLIESNEEIEEHATSVLLESNGKIGEPPKSIPFESYKEIEKPLTSILQKPTAVNNASSATDLPPSFTTLQPSSFPQTNLESPPTLRKYIEEAEDLNEEPPEPPHLVYQVHFFK